MTIRLPEDLDRALDAVARARHVSKHALILEAADRFLREESRTDDTLAVATGVAERYTELLTRLEDA